MPDEAIYAPTSFAFAGPRPFMSLFFRAKTIYPLRPSRSFAKVPHLTYVSLLLCRPRNRTLVNFSSMGDVKTSWIDSNDLDCVSGIQRKSTMSVVAVKAAKRK